MESSGRRRAWDSFAIHDVVVVIIYIEALLNIGGCNIRQIVCYPFPDLITVETTLSMIKKSLVFVE